MPTYNSALYDEQIEARPGGNAGGVKIDPGDSKGCVGLRCFFARAEQPAGQALATNDYVRLFRLPRQGAWPAMVTERHPANGGNSGIFIGSVRGGSDTPASANDDAHTGNINVRAASNAGTLRAANFEKTRSRLVFAKAAGAVNAAAKFAVGMIYGTPTDAQ